MYFKKAPLLNCVYTQGADKSCDILKLGVWYRFIPLTDGDNMYFAVV